MRQIRRRQRVCGRDEEISRSGRCERQRQERWTYAAKPSREGYRHQECGIKQVTIEDGCEQDPREERDSGGEKGDCVSRRAALESKRCAQRNSSGPAKLTGKLGRT